MGARPGRVLGALGGPLHFGTRAALLLALGLAALQLVGGPTASNDVAIHAANAADPALQSDEFDSGSLDAGLWRVFDPVGDSGVSVGSGRLRVSVPAGVRHDLWEGALEAPRVLQAAPDADFEVEAKFDSAVTLTHQVQGLVAQAGVGTLVRFDVHSAQGATKVFAATFVNGQATVRVYASIPVGAPVFLRMKRAGSAWTLSYSGDGGSWTVAASFSFSLAVNEVGLFAGNVGQPPPAFTALVDYFRVVGEGAPPPPPPDEDPPVISGVAVSAGTTAATVTWSTNEPADSRVEYGTTSAYGATRSSSDLVTSHSVSLVELECGTTYHFRVSSADAAGNRASSPDKTFSTAACPPPPPPDEDPPVISGVAVSAGTTAATVTWSTDEPADSRVEYGASAALGETRSGSVLVTSHGVGLSGLVCETTYHYRVSSADAAGNRATSAIATFVTASCPVEGSLQSDEFDSGSLDAGLWRVFDPVGDSGVSVGSGRLRVSVPAGVRHDLWEGALEAPRVLQAAPDADFEVEAKFDSAVTLTHQVQGLVAQAGVGTLVRFDVHSAQGATKVFAATFVNGQATVRVYASIPVGAPVFLRMKRAGSAWTLSYSGDGGSWTVAASFSFSLAVNEVGLFAGNVGQPPPAFTALVDYFRVVGEGAPPPPPPDEDPPVISGVAVSAGTTAATVTWSTDEPADSRVEYGPTAAYGATRSSGSLVTAHSVNLSGLACETTYHYRVSSADAAGNRATSPDATFTTGTCPATPVLRSDTFEGGALDLSLWRVHDPVGDVETTVQDGELRVSVPGGVRHDLWEGALEATRILQSAPDADFEVEARFNSPVGPSHQIQGLVAQAGAGTFVRYDIHSAAGATKVFAATFVNGQANVRVHSTIPVSAPVFLRMKREGSTWALGYSADATTWTTAASFTFSFSLTEVGIFAGNAGSPPPAFASRVAHFHVVGDGPPPPPPPPPDEDPPVISGVAVNAGTTAATVTWSTDEPADSRVEYGPTSAYGETRSSPSLVTSHSINLSALTCETTYHYRVSSADASGNRATSPDASFTTGTCGPSAGPEINIWYGDVQQFGQHGFAQRWLNILGHASDPDGLLWIAYRVNDGAWVSPVAYAPDWNPRLARYGDFNIELDRLALSPGQHVVTIRAADRLGNESMRAVEVDVVGTTVWPLPFETDWSSGIWQSAQVVDGLWTVDSGGARTAVPGYDRLLAIGDETWSSVDVTVPVTIHSIDPTTPHAGVGIAAGWRGHEGEDRPRLEWPLGALCFYYRDRVTDPYQLWLVQYPEWPYFFQTDGRPNRLELATPYMFRFEARPVDPLHSRYSCKVWPVGDPEPTDWDVSAVLATRAGSVLLVAHHADVTFGPVNIEEATG
jgi:chitodextrinase